MCFIRHHEGLDKDTSCYAIREESKQVFWMFKIVRNTINRVLINSNCLLRWSTFRWSVVYVLLFAIKILINHLETIDKYHQVWMCVVNACGTSVSIYSYTCMSWIIGKLIKTYIYWVFRKSVSLLKCGKTQLMIILFLIQCLVVLAFLSHAQRNWQNCFV